MAIASGLTAAAIGAAGAVGSAALSSRASSRATNATNAAASAAADRSYDAARYTADRSYESAQEANNLLRYFYDTTRSDNAPLVTARNSAVPHVMALLGGQATGAPIALPPPPPPAASYPTAAATPAAANARSGAQPDWNGYLDANGDVANWRQGLDGRDAAWVDGSQYGNGDGVVDGREAAMYHYFTHGQNEGRALPQLQTGGPAAATAPPPAPAAPASPAYTFGAGSAGGLNGSDPAALEAYITSLPGFDAAQRNAERAFLAHAGRIGALDSGYSFDNLADIGYNTFNQFRQQELDNVFRLINAGSGAANANQAAGSTYATGASANLTNATNSANNAYLGATNAANAFGVNAANANASAYQANADNWGGALGFSANQFSNWWDGRK